MVARCELELGHLERRLGLNPAGRAKKVAHGNLADWGALAHELRILRAYDLARSEPEKARSLLLEARAHAEAHTDRRLLLRVDRALREAGLVAADIEPLDTDDTVADGPIIASGTSRLDDATPLPGAVPGLLPYDDDSDGAQVTLNPRLPAAARFISPNVRTSPTVRLHEPRAGGARRLPTAKEGT
jgi:hypothetical protein